MFLRLYSGVTTWWSDLKVRAQEERGATAVEYALMVALIAVVIIAAVTLLGNNASTKFNSVADAVGGAGAGS
jgi:pilus assembly protein Flp/PilA